MTSMRAAHMGLTTQLEDDVLRIHRAWSVRTA
jgi:hypothetical protein